MIIVAIGANLAWRGLSPAQSVSGAMIAVAQLGENVSKSSLYQSPAWPDPKEPAYVNAVMTMETDIEAKAFLKALHAIEAGFGRTRSYLTGMADRYAARTLDLDLIAYKGEVIGNDPQKGIVLPHPSLQDRDFVLLPLAEIAPDWQHPVLNRTTLEMLDQLDKPFATHKL